MPLEPLRKERKVKVTLVSPPSEKGKYEHEHFVIPKNGIGYIAAYLEKNGIDCSILDAKFEGLNFEQVIKRLTEEKPDIVGISAMTSEIESGARVAAKVKRILPRSKTVIGGAHAISIPNETLKEFSQFDFLVTGEGEITFLELVKAIAEDKDLGHVKGILFRRDGEIKTNPPRPWIDDLDQLPFPAWHKYPQKSPFYYVLSTRGCPHQCAFCMTILGKKQRKRSPENVVDELEWLWNTYKVDQMIFLDETFTLDRKRTDQLLGMIIDRGLDRKMKWVAQTRVDRVDEAICRRMKESGCYKIEFGVESGNQKILEIIKKGITLRQVEEAVRSAKRAGLQVGCSFILGHPYETRETAQDTINFIVRLNPDIISIGIMVPHPGTRVYEMAQRGEGNYRLIAAHWSEYVKFGGGGLELKDLPRHELEKLQVKAYLNFYLKNYRFFDLISYGFEHWSQALAAAKKLTAQH